MGDPHTARHSELFSEIQSITDRLVSEAAATTVFLVGRNAQPIVRPAGDAAGLDTTSVGELLADNDIAVGLVKQLKEDGFAALLPHSGNTALYLQFIQKRAMLFVCYDQRSSLALVRFRSRVAGEALARIFDQSLPAMAESVPDPLIPEFTDEDLNNLFGIGTWFGR